MKIPHRKIAITKRRVDSDNIITDTIAIDNTITHITWSIKSNGVF